MTLDYTQLGAVAAVTEDLTVDKKFERELPRAGVALVRLKDYIELGRHQPTNQSHKPAVMVKLVFELSHPDHLVEIDGKKVPGQLMVNAKVGSTAKSGYRKLFKVMNNACGGNKKHFVQMINAPFLAEIYHNTSGEGDKATTYANLDLDGAYSLKAPVTVDVLTNEATPVAIPELHGKPRVFVWNNDTNNDDGTKCYTDEMVTAMWDSIFIEGTRDDVDASGKKSEKSKNWIQEKIQDNLEWEGSRTQNLTQEELSLDGIPDPQAALEGTLLLKEDEVPTI